MIQLTAKTAWICLFAVFCLPLALILRLLPSRHINISAHLTPADIREIMSVVRRENLARKRSPVIKWAPATVQQWVANVACPIKSIEDTTNNAYEFDRRILSSLAVEAMTNPAVERELRIMEKRVRAQSGAATNPAVEVWYADTGARWGAAGYFLEKRSNAWKITVGLFQ